MRAWAYAAVIVCGCASRTANEPGVSNDDVGPPFAEDGADQQLRDSEPVPTDGEVSADVPPQTDAPSSVGASCDARTWSTATPYRGRSHGCGTPKSMESACKCGRTGALTVTGDGAPRVLGLDCNDGPSWIDGRYCNPSTLDACDESGCLHIMSWFDETRGYYVARDGACLDLFDITLRFDWKDAKKPSAPVLGEYVTGSFSAIGESCSRTLKLSGTFTACFAGYGLVTFCE